jgi:hypothetical protein
LSRRYHRYTRIAPRQTRPDVVPSKRRRIAETIGGILLLLVLVWAGITTGAGGVGIVILLLVGIVWVIVMVIVMAVRAVMSSVVRCRHGVRGARSFPSRCPECAREIAEREAKQKAEAEQRAEDEKRRRQAIYAEYRARIRLPGYLYTMDPYEFEHLVCEVFRRRGYEVKETPKSGDDGVDGLLRKEGKLYLLQCKRVKKGVGAPVVRDFYGAMTHERATGGFLVTTGRTTEAARNWAKGKPITILELEKFSDMVRESFPENEIVPDDWQLRVHLDQFPPPRV